MCSSRTPRRLILWVLLTGLCAWVAASVYLGEIMLRLPRKALPVITKWEVAAPEDAAITSADGVPMAAWLFTSPRSRGAAVIVLHGQTDNRAGMLGYANLFLRNGYDVLAPDLRGHGASGGELSTYGFLEADDLRRWLDWLAARRPGERVFGFGESMGAAILIQSLAVESRFCAVVAEAPYASLREIAYDRLSQRWGASTWPGRYPLRPILELAIVYDRVRYGVDLDRVSPETAVRASHTPVLLIYGSEDRNTPPRHARRIHQGNPARVSLWQIPTSAHAGAWGALPLEFEKRVLAWFSPDR
ncbi:MAG TPA: alpha/beta fold hydrolase [Bryobacteraceae bacterium]|nr:alpha/beta fold hydrolase [Bryobacteraceae bacterium]